MLEKELRANWDSVFYPEPEPQVETFGEEVQSVDEPVLLAAGPSGTVSDAGAGRGSYAGFDPRMDAASKGPQPQIKAIDPTMRQQLADFLQAGFERLGASRNTARKNAQTIMGGGSSNLPIGVGLADIVPFLGTALQTEEAAIAGGQAVEAVKRGDLGEAGVQAGMAAVGMIPGAAGTVRGARTAIKGAQAAGKALAPKAGEMLDAYMQRSGMQANLMAYHGSPHRFDKFQAGKIGTGEGAQSYGYGLYFAESPDVAKSYMAVNPSVLPPPVRTFKGAELEPGSPEYHAATLLDSMSLTQAQKMVAGWIKEADPRMAREAEGWAKTLETLNSAQSKTDFKRLKSKGNLYTVDIPDEMLAKMLDWDKPLSQQNESVRTFFADVPNPPNAEAPIGPWLQGRFKEGADQLWAEDMRKAGIPGIRYLDQGSRGTGEGTRNIVVFPGGENQIKIIKREGQGK